MLNCRWPYIAGHPRPICRDGYQRIVVREILGSRSHSRGHEPPHSVAISDQAHRPAEVPGASDRTVPAVWCFGRPSGLPAHRPLPVRPTFGWLRSCRHRSEGSGECRRSPLRNPFAEKATRTSGVRGHFHPRWRQIHRLEACGRRTSLYRSPDASRGESVRSLPRLRPRYSRHRTPAARSGSGSRCPCIARRASGLNREPAGRRTDLSAANRIGGNCFPRFAARRSIPAQALALK